VVNDGQKTRSNATTDGGFMIYTIAIGGFFLYCVILGILSLYEGYLYFFTDKDTEILSNLTTVMTILMFSVIILLILVLD